MTAALPGTEEQRIITRERLRLLAIGHYIYGGMGVFMLPMFLPFVGLMVFMAAIPAEQWSKSPPASPARQLEPPDAVAPPSPTPSRDRTSEAPPRFIFAIFGIIFCAIFLALATLSALTAYAGRCIQKRRRKTLIYVVFGLNCVFVPYGTLLGVCTILVLGSPGAQAEFVAAAPA